MYDLARGVDCGVQRVRNTSRLREVSKSVWRAKLGPRVCLAGRLDLEP